MASDTREFGPYMKHLISITMANIVLAESKTTEEALTALETDEGKGDVFNRALDKVDTAIEEMLDSGNTQIGKTEEEIAKNMVIFLTKGRMKE